MIVRPRTQSLLAWQFTGQPFHEWPSWVQESCTLRRRYDRLELLHTRRSGKQVVYLTEWLVKDLDGEACYYTDVEFATNFVVERPQRGAEV